jgi:hypothetical protein
MLGDYPSMPGMGCGGWGMYPAFSTPLAFHYAYGAVPAKVCVCTCSLSFGLAPATMFGEHLWVGVIGNPAGDPNTNAYTLCGRRAAPPPHPPLQPTRTAQSPGPTGEFAVWAGMYLLYGGKCASGRDLHPVT